MATGVSKWTERARSSPYFPALRHPVFRKVLPGAALSALGDGMSAVAIAWLAVKLAPAGSRGLWVGAAVAAYSLPGAVGAVMLRRWLAAAAARGLAHDDRHCVRLGPGAYPARAAHPAVGRARDVLRGRGHLGPADLAIHGVFQDASPPDALAQVIAARSALLILAAPIGTALGGPLVTALGARGTLLLSALATIALALVTLAVRARSRLCVTSSGI